jgi:hypothetical protein
VPPGSTYGVVIPETRRQRKLLWLVRDVLRKVPPTWRVVVYHSTENADFLRRGLAELELPPKAAARVTLLQHDPAWLGETGPHVNDFANGIMTSPSWWRALPAGMDGFLLLQTDAVLCRADWGLLQEVAAYDYVGAPWHPSLTLPQVGGNGGLSWRSRPAALALLNVTTFEEPKHSHEDVFFSALLPPGRVAPRELACRFAVETDLCARSGGGSGGNDSAALPPLGVHAAWKWGRYHHAWDLILEGCPDAVHVMGGDGGGGGRRSLRALPP